MVVVASERQRTRPEPDRGERAKGILDGAIASQKAREAAMKDLFALAADIEGELDAGTPHDDIQVLVQHLITLTSHAWAEETHVRETLVRKRRELFGPTRLSRRSALAGAADDHVH